MPTPAPTPTATPTPVPSPTPTPTPAPTPTPSPTPLRPGINVTFPVQDNGYVRAYTPDYSYCNETFLLVDLKDPVTNLDLYRDITFLKFTVTGLTGPAKNAWVKLFVLTGSTQTGGRIHSTSTDWDACSITYNNMPPGVIDSPVLDWRGPVAFGTWVSFNVTPAITGSGTFAFAIDSINSAAASYASSRAHLGRAPELVVTP